MSTEYTKSRNLQPCRLKRTDLLKLIHISQETSLVATAKRTFKISTDLPNLNITSSGVDQFLEHEQLPDRLNRLSIEVMEMNKDFDTLGRVWLRFYETEIVLDVSGSDETWVLGKFVRITDFIRRHRRWFWFLPGIFPFIVAPIWVVSLASLRKLLAAGQMIVSASTVVLLAASILATVFYFRGSLFPYTQVILRAKQPLFTKENVTLIVAVLSLIVSIVGGLLLPLVK